LVVVAGNLTGIRYRDEIVQPYVIPFIQAQVNNVQGVEKCLWDIVPNADQCRIHFR
jgi:hypothetical protein